MPPTSSPSHLRWLVPVLIVVVSLTVGGGLVARELYRPPTADEDAPATRPSTTSVPPERQPGSGRVELTTDAAAHPQAEPVRAVLQAHFDAINNRDYDQWASTVVTARVQAQPQQEWLANYRSTRDGSILVYRIEAAPGQRLTVLIGFTSTQHVADAPPDLPVDCIRWRLALPLTQEYGDWRIDTIPAGSTPEREPC